MKPVQTQGPPWNGHSVLQVPVPELEDWVRRRTAHHDPAFVSADPRFVHAHVTALGPFVTQVEDGVRARVAAIAARVEPFSYRLCRVETFPDGIVHLLPVPDDPFTRLTSLLMAEFPEHPPYGGRFTPVPHLTLDLVHGGVTEASTRKLLGDRLPVAGRADSLDLAWYESGRCHLMGRWLLGTGGWASPFPTSS